MSCEGNRQHFILHLVNHTDLAQKLGVAPALAAQFLERLYQSARSGSQLRSETPEADVESAFTAKFFERMRAVGLKPPTHSPSGMPKLASRAGYGQLERVLQAVEQGKPLPKGREAQRRPGWRADRRMTWDISWARNTAKAARGGRWWSSGSSVTASMRAVIGRRTNPARGDAGQRMSTMWSSGAPYRQPLDCWQKAASCVPRREWSKCTMQTDAWSRRMTRTHKPPEMCTATRTPARSKWRPCWPDACWICKAPLIMP